MFAVVFYH